MSDQNLRDALEKYFSNGGPDTPIRTTWHDGVEHWEAPASDIRALLAAHPVEPAPVADWKRLDESDAASAQMIQWYAPKTYAAIRDARPLLDREAVTKLVRGAGYERLTDDVVADVMKLAQPMPTQAELTDWLRDIFVTDADPEGTSWGVAAELLLALLNGAES